MYCSLLCSEVDKLYQTNSEDEASQASSFKGSRKRMLVTLYYYTACSFPHVVAEATSLKPSLDVFSDFVKRLSVTNNAIKREDAGM